MLRTCLYYSGKGASRKEKLALSNCKRKRKITKTRVICNLTIHFQALSHKCHHIALASLLGATQLPWRQMNS